jgi:diguanylate cyclase (GGDEF)-like protein
LVDCKGAEAKDEFKCIQLESVCLNRLSKFDEALPLAGRALELATEMGDDRSQALAHNNLGLIHWQLDDYATAMDHYLAALKLAQAGRFPDIEPRLINGLGLVQYGLGNHEAALEYFRDFLNKVQPNQFKDLMRANNNVAYVLHLLGRDESALPYSLAAVAFEERANSTSATMEALHTLGAIYLKLGDDETAAAQLQRGLSISREHDNTLMQVTFALKIASIHLNRGELDIAERELLDILPVAERINSLTNLSLVHQRLAETYKRSDDYRRAFEHFEAYHAIYERLFNEQSDRRVKRLEVLHQVEITRKQADMYRQIATTDFLTGLLSRRQFVEFAEVKLRQAAAAGEQFALIMVDIDHFKRINDRHGHPAGDKVLAEVAARLRDQLRHGDLIGRYGGEEFVALVSDPSPQAWLRVAERFRTAVVQVPFEIDTQPLAVTISVGLATFTAETPCSFAELVERADQALYAAKRGGRDQVVVWVPQARQIDLP